MALSHLLFPTIYSEQLTCNQQNICDDYASSMQAIQDFILYAQNKTFSTQYTIYLGARVQFDAGFAS